MTLKPVLSQRIVFGIILILLMFLFPFYSLTYTGGGHNKTGECIRGSFDNCSVTLGFPFPYLSSGKNMHFKNDRAFYFFKIGFIMNVIIWIASFTLFYKKRYQSLFYFNFIFLLWAIFIGLMTVIYYL